MKRSATSQVLSAPAPNTASLSSELCDTPRLPCHRAHDFYGAHPANRGYVFRVYAPHAQQVFVVGEFCDWQGGIELSPTLPSGAWQGHVPEARDGQLYKFRIITHSGREVYKADPYARMAECPPGTASRLFHSDYRWHDEGWLAHRAATMARGGYERAPVNIYELHASSWLRHEDGSLLSYTELAHELAPYVKQMGYTHIELLPVMEHPFDGSWGYQVCGYFAPTARHGSPDDLRALVDTMHEAGIGVIFDWVPAHFPKDAHGLCEFDGEPLYEYSDTQRAEHRIWGTRCFDLGREYVQDFLISGATYWIEEFHADGLRVDAVAAMLYLDYDRASSEWTPNIYGDNRNLDAIAFFKKLNGLLHIAHPDVLTIAEESGDFGGITAEDGLGFSLKWNMGWMNDTLNYATVDPLYRKRHHDKMTFSLTYAFSEHFVLPISHDEVVHGKRSFLDRMPGDYAQKFAGERVFYAWQMTHPGKKLTFMGSEIGQFREWDYADSVEWFLTDYEAHAAMQRYFAALNHFYLQNAALYACDGDWNGFNWLDADNADESILAYRRTSPPATDGRPRELIVVLNLTPVTRKGFRLGIDRGGTYREVFSSDDEAFGGSGLRNTHALQVQNIPWRGQKHSLVLDLPGLSALILAPAADEAATSYEIPLF